MKSLRLILVPLAVALTSAIIVGCASTDCTENKSSLPLAQFIDSESGQAVSLNWVSIYAIGAPGDSILEDSVTNLSQVFLPFNNDAETTRYVIHFLSQDPDNDGISDTITFKYQVLPYFTGAECGAIYKYKLQDISCTHNVIDSVTGPENGVIDNTNMVNLNIYLLTEL